jgi:hypothetical protein
MIRLTSRNGWVKYGLLAVLVAGGGAGGFYLSEGWPSSANPAPSQNLPIDDSPPPAQRFPLSTFDRKDTVEAPSLASTQDGHLFVAWASKTGDAERTVFLTQSADGGRSFETPRRISKGGIYKTPAKGKSGGHERRGTPHVVTVGNQLHLAWCEAVADGSGQRMLLASSSDAGRSFTKPMPVHRQERIRAAFTSFRTGPDGSLVCSWLDDRSGAQQPFASVRPAGAASFEPERAAYLGEDGQGVCPCCPTATCIAPDGTVYVAFRNIHEGYRDMAITRLRPGQTKFDGPFAVVSNAWKFDGCPHDGPSMAILGDTLHVAWMDARTGAQRCYYGRANLAGMKFETRELHPATGTQGNPKLLADASGNLHAVWEQSTGSEPAADSQPGHNHGTPKLGAGSGRAIFHARLPAGHSWFGPTQAIDPRSGSFQTRPTLTPTSDGHLFAAWMELDETGKNVVVARLPRDEK